MNYQIIDDTTDTTNDRLIISGEDITDESFYL
jgi:hypothetical protein